MSQAGVPPALPSKYPYALGAGADGGGSWSEVTGGNMAEIGRKDRGDVGERWDSVRWGVFVM